MGQFHHNRDFNLPLMHSVLCPDVCVCAASPLSLCVPHLNLILHEIRQLVSLAEEVKLSHPSFFPPQKSLNVLIIIGFLLG